MRISSAPARRTGTMRWSACRGSPDFRDGTRSLVRPPGDELLEADVAVAFRVGGVEIELALGAGDVAIELRQQHVELSGVDETVAVEVAGIEDFPRLRNVGLGQRCHGRSSFHGTAL